jgi:RNA polymerase sigma-70 factor, ECF subfamily
MKDNEMHLSDQLLVTMVLKGNRAAFETIMIRHQEKISRIIAGRVPFERVTEIMQDTFIRAYRSLGNYSQKKPLLHWLSVIAVRTCLDFWRTAYRNREVPISQLGEDAINWLTTIAAPDPNAANGPKNTGMGAAQVLEWIMPQLSADERMVLSLTYLEGYSTSETAELLGWSQSNVKVKNFRAKQKLRGFLKKFYKTHPGQEGNIHG